MATIKGEIIATNPLCTPRFLKDKSSLSLEHILEYYREREKKIDYYIILFKKAYAMYGYNNPFTDYGKEDQRFINADFSSPSMQKKIKIVYQYEPHWSKGIEEAINEYIIRRCYKYFGNNYSLNLSYKNYFYFLALDETLYNIYKDNKKYLNKTTNKKLTHQDLIKDYVEIALGITKKNYEDDPLYISPEELQGMGLEEVPEGYEMDEFLGPKGPGR